jgi:Calcineurin-like phosphoesterase
LIVIVGDPHGQWDSEDEAAVTKLGPHGLLFVGEIGDEDPELVGNIADLARQSLRGRAAVALGNHDARCASAGAFDDQVSMILWLQRDNARGYEFEFCSAVCTLPKGA